MQGDPATRQMKTRRGFRISDSEQSVTAVGNMERFEEKINLHRICRLLLGDAVITTNSRSSMAYKNKGLLLSHNGSPP